MAPFKDIKKKNSTGIHPNEDVIHSIINVICMLSTNEIHFGTEISCCNGNRCDILLTSIAKKIAVIIKIKFNKTAEEELNKIIDKRYIEAIPEDNTLFEIRIFIGLNINNQLECNYKYQIEDYRYKGKN